MISDKDKLLINPYGIGVLVIDMHKGHLGTREPADAVCPTLLGRTIVQSLERFLASVRALEIPVVFIRFGARRGFIDCKSKFWSSEKVLSAVPRYHELNVEPIPEDWYVVTPEPTDYQVTGKRRYSGFFGTDLDILLRRLGVDTVVLTGIDTDVCVLSTAWDAVNRDYLTFVLRDCTHCSSEEAKESALSIMDRWIGWVLESTDFLSVIRELRSEVRAASTMTPKSPFDGNDVAWKLQKAYREGFSSGVQAVVGALKNGRSLHQIEAWCRGVVVPSQGARGTAELGGGSD